MISWLVPLIAGLIIFIPSTILINAGKIVILNIGGIDPLLVVLGLIGLIATVSGTIQIPRGKTEKGIKK